VKLGLGTVQFGMDYGISNRDGKTPAEEVSRILDVAARNGIRFLDTASLYGNSEEVLGTALPRNHSFSVITKTAVFSAKAIHAEDVRLLEQCFERSLHNLKLPAVYALLTHHADDVLAPNGDLLIKKMMELKQTGLVSKIGVSVYRGEQIDAVMDRFSIDLVQLPINVLDQRMLQNGHLRKLKKAGIEVHARSVFLQGLLLMDPADLSPYFEPVREHLRRYHETLRRHGLSAVQGALGFVAGLDDVDVVLCGVNNHRQLQEICSQWKACSADLFAEFAVSDEGIVIPSRWRVA